MASGTRDIDIHTISDVYVAPAKETNIVQAVEAKALVGAGRAKTERKHDIVAISRINCLMR